MPSLDRCPGHPANEPAAPPASAPGVGHFPLRVLIVDDDADGAESLAILVRLWGHQARTALDGPAAVQLAAVWQPDVVVCDIVLPGMDGLQLAAELRRRPECRDTLLWAVSGRQGLAAQAQAAGFDRYFLKPMDLADLKRGLVRHRPTGAAPLPGV